jgi:hypothetical protein
VARAVAPELRIAANVDMLATYRGTGDDLVMGETLRATLGAEWEAGRWGNRANLELGFLAYLTLDFGR